MQYKVTIKKLPKSEVEIEGELDIDIFEAYFKKALQKISKDLEIPGFRKGKAPESVLLSKIPESQILGEMAELALSEHYPLILKEQNIDAISRPDITITKLARKNPLGFKIKTATMPIMEMPDYKKLAKDVLTKTTEEEKNTEVTEKELEDTILDIRKSRAPKTHMAEQFEISQTSDVKNSPTSDVEEEDHDHKHEEVKEEVKEEDLPEFNDDFVKALGPFKDIADFKEKLKANIKLEKENQVKEKLRLKIVEKIMKELVVELPEILVEIELDKIIYKMHSDISAMGLKFEDYLKHLGKTIEDIRKELRGDAEKKAKVGLIVHNIAVTEKITPDPEQVANEVAQILAYYKDADPERAKSHAENVLTNEGVFQLLESQN